ncbi:putative iron-only hydrogenase system regulator [Desulfosporosinus orientis DSM 765]|uniref:Putative iron-only hydrogenase system regulator n=1 Tax=Desulfosporosinus orientis (strain ATCC 19365 / DSM 765 / NCIMB 8382 / VKM B-1628 / Singapore I) TaxID=768706 RepID=G7W6T0_DESOD|nr:TM1266 family iron-only hydrogenase system putative regulator [Desulfosporosinus orientis]AET69212.1 putative iron-only hydrogenase system regulator [Desulfosporosinus orientis DSM 765]
METRVAIIGIIVEDVDSVEKLNGILHNYGRYIIGRMGIPYREKGINIISLAVDAPQDIISALSGKLGRLPGVSTKAVYSKSKDKAENGGSDEKTDR